MISRDEKVECPWCGSKTTVGECNDLTYSYCKNREMRRRFTPLTNEKAFRHNADCFYVCKECGKWCRGSQLRIVDTDDENLRALGGEPVIISKGD